MDFEVEDPPPPSWFGNLDESLQGKILKLSQKQRNHLFTFYEGGFHENITGAIRCIHDILNQQECFKLFRACGDAYSKRTPPDREILDAIYTVYNTKSPKGAKISKWPETNEALRKQIISKSPIKLEEDFIKEFGGNNKPPRHILKTLFPENPLVCMGEDQYGTTVRLLEDCLKVDELPQLIVPSPMLGYTGKTKGGKDSGRCENNVGERLYLVIEWDDCTIPEQLAFGAHLAEFAPLVTAVYSGGKSVHFWFDCSRSGVVSQRAFMEYAVSLGADKSSWRLSQFIRTPGAKRDNGNLQRVISFRPELLAGAWNVEKLPKLGLHRKSVKHVDDVSLKLISTDFVEQLLTKGGFSCLLGQPGTGKSFLALDLSAHVSAGKKWRDKDVKQGGVFYVCLEGEAMFNNRVEALKRNGLLVGKPFWIDNSLNLLSTESIDSFTEYVNWTQEMFGEVKLIVIDTLAQAAPGLNENASEDMSKVIEGVKTIIRTTGCHVMLVHHLGKDDNRGARGHSSLNGALDTEITIKSINKDEKKATITKQKDFEGGQVYPFRLIPKFLAFDDKKREITTMTVGHHWDKVLPEGSKKKGAPRKTGPEGLWGLLPAENKADWMQRAKELFQIKDTTFYTHSRPLQEGTHYVIKDDGSIEPIEPPGWECF